MILLECIPIWLFSYEFYEICRTPPSECFNEFNIRGSSRTYSIWLTSFKRCIRAWFEKEAKFLFCKQLCQSWIDKVKSKHKHIPTCFNEYKAVTYLCSYSSKSEDQCSQGMKESAKEAFENNFDKYENGNLTSLLK